MSILECNPYKFRLHLAIVFYEFYDFFAFSYFRRSVRAVQSSVNFLHFCVFSLLSILVFFQNLIENVERAAQNVSKRRTGKSRKSPEPMHVMVSEVFFV